jgi:hypothetical protein
MRIASLVAVSLGACALSLGAGLAGCNVHDNTINIPDATLTVSTDADPQNIQPMQTVPMTVEVHNVYLVEPTATPPPEHVADAGHLEFHLDDESTPALLVTAQTNVNVTIPANTSPGHHKIICRVHKHDGTPTDTEFELDINVRVSASASSTADGGSSATVEVGVSVEAGVVTTTGSAGAGGI